MQFFKESSFEQQCFSAIHNGLVLDAAEVINDRRSISGQQYGRVPAGIIRDVLLAPDLKADPRGFRISNAYITGHLGLDHAVLRCALAFMHCYFEHPPSFRDMSVPSLDIAEATFVPGMSLSRTVVRSDMNMAGLRSTGTMDARGMQAGAVNLSDADLQVSAGTCLALDGATLSGRLLLNGATSVGAVSARNAVMDELDLTGARLSNADGEALNLTGATIKGKVSLSKVCTAGAVSAFGAHLGQLDLTRACLRADPGTALELSGAVVEGTAFCFDMKVAGAVNAADSSFNELILTRATLESQGGRGRTLNLARVRVKGSATLTGLASTGTIFMFGAQVGQLDMRDVTATAGEGTAVEVSKIEVRGTADCSGMRTTGSVHAADAQFAQLKLQNAVLHREDGVAANFARVKVSGKSSLTGLKAFGQFTAQDAEFGSFLDFDGARFVNSQSEALKIDGARIGGGVTLRHVFALGKVSATGLRPRSLEISSTKIQGPPGDVSLDLSGANVTDLTLVKDAAFHGTFRAVGARFSQLSIGSTSFFAPDFLTPDGDPCSAASASVVRSGQPPAAEDPGGVSAGDVALHLDQTVVAGDAVLDGICAKGEVRAIGANVQGKLVIDGGTRLQKGNSGNGKSHALGLDLATIQVLMLKRFTAEGGLNFRATKIRALYVDDDVDPGNPLPDISSAQGWELGSVHGYLHADRQRTQDWLDTMKPNGRNFTRWWSGEEFVSQPWKEMAKVFEQSGQPAAARKLRYEAAKRTTQFAPAWSKPLRWLYLAFTGYGYYPLIAIAWLIAIGLAVFILASTQASDFTPTEASASLSQGVPVTGASSEPPARYPQFQPALFAVETAVPAADTGQARAWRVTGNSWLPIVLGAFKAFGWLLTALLLAGITGLLRKD